MAMKRTTIGAGMLITVVLLACKQEAKKEEIAPPPPTVTAAAAPTPEATPTPAPAESAPPSGGSESKTGIPTSGTSKPPTVAEWGAVGEITVRHSTPLNCETKLVREWLRVSCRTSDNSANQIQTVKLTRGNDSGGIPPFMKKGVASIVTRVRPGIDADWTFEWTQWGKRVLTVKWPHGAPAPTYEFDQTAPK
ncbi:MAG: hypothetical protein DYH12_26815 [Sorangiineae bacterium PRO1]|nr:hypothetical protein [Sorangiineae bacterium PRO1]